MIVEIAEYRFNMKNIIQLFSIALTAATLPMITSCDSGGGSGTEISNLPSRFDLASLAANPDDTASFPSSLIATDRLVLDPSAALDNFYRTTGATVPRSEDEADWSFTPQSSGLVQIERLFYDFTRTSGQVAGISINPANTTSTNQFDIDMITARDTGASTSSGLAGLLQRNSPNLTLQTGVIRDFTDEEDSILTAAIESFGYDTETFTFPYAAGSFFAPDNQTLRTGVEHLAVLRSRTITFTIDPNSSNDNLLTNRTIFGRFSMTETYWHLDLLSTSGQTLDAFTIGRAPAPNGGTTGPFLFNTTLTPLVSGDFTLTLGDLETINPNP